LLKEVVDDPEKVKGTYNYVLADMLGKLLRCKYGILKRNFKLWKQATGAVGQHMSWYVRVQKKMLFPAIWFMGMIRETVMPMHRKF
jgi:hypothetical protein